MMSNDYDNSPEESNFESITVKVEHPEYGPMETSTTASELSTMRLFNEPDSTETFMQYKNDVYQKLMGEESVIDFIENSIDKFLVNFQKDKTDKRTKGAERQRIYRLNETTSQREKRLATARQYIRQRRENETDEERYERLKKQRERIRALRHARKLNPEFDKERRKEEAERMKMRRANESPQQRMLRLEKSRMYSKKKRENETYRKTENEKNRVAHQTKRSDQSFREQERIKDKFRKRTKRELEYDERVPISLCNLEVCIST